jgi:hypothetical protein
MKAKAELTIESAGKMKVEELKTALRERGLPTVGKKQDLFERLIESLKEVEAAPSSDVPIPPPEKGYFYFYVNVLREHFDS